MAAQTFHRFPDLPKELRDEIWRQCLPHRVVEVDLPDQEYLAWCVHERNRQSSHDSDCQRQRQCELRPTSRRNSATPTIARVCQESRKIAFQEADLTVFEPSMTIVPWRSWADYKRDTAHLHCDTYLSELVGLRGTDLLQDRLEAISRFQSASLCADLLDSVYRRIRREIMDCLLKRPSWSICGAYVWIHVTDEAAIANSGLWGPLGEERIVLVDARDTKQISAFCNFWKTQGTEEDSDTKAFFEACVDGIPKVHYQETPTEFLQDLQVRWLHDHVAFEDQNVVEELQRQIWLMTPGDFDGREDDPRQADYGHLLGRPFARQLWSPNREHPWVRRILEHMPEIQPTVMFRLCTSNCLSRVRDTDVDNGST